MCLLKINGKKCMTKIGWILKSMYLIWAHLSSACRSNDDKSRTKIYSCLIKSTKYKTLSILIDVYTRTRYSTIKNIIIYARYMWQLMTVNVEVKVKDWNNLAGIIGKLEKSHRQTYLYDCVQKVMNLTAWNFEN